MTYEPIAVVHSPRTDRLDDHWGSIDSTIELDERFSPQALDGIEAFSHIEVVFVFHGIREDDIETTSRRPRNNPSWPEVGIFAQRGARRPNRIGVSRCSLLGRNGRTLHVRGLDAIDGTPVVDIKPYIREFGVDGKTRQPQWADEIMRDYYAE